MEWITTTQVLETLKTSDNAVVWQGFRDNFFPILVNFARHIGLNPTDAEDAAQNTMLEFLFTVGLESGSFYWLSGGFI